MMRRRTAVKIALPLVLGVSALCLPFAAQAEDFFSALFGAFGARMHMPQPAPSFSPFGGDEGQVEVPRRRAAYGGGQAWCVRSCDGRYFPIAGADNNSRVQACNDFCPASQTTVVYGSDVDGAVTETGQAYSDLPNAFRYRNELVAGCTCNGKDTAGLAPVSIDNDPTLRKGDLVAGADGLRVVTRGADRRTSANFTPLPQSAQARYRNLPMVAAGR
jgi:hypothetical protein